MCNLLNDAVANTCRFLYKRLVVVRLSTRVEMCSGGCRCLVDRLAQGIDSPWWEKAEGGAGHDTWVFVSATDC